MTEIKQLCSCADLSTIDSCTDVDDSLGGSEFETSFINYSLPVPPPPYNEAAPIGAVNVECQTIDEGSAEIGGNDNLDMWFAGETAIESSDFDGDRARVPDGTIDMLPTWAELNDMSAVDGAVTQLHKRTLKPIAKYVEQFGLTDERTLGGPVTPANGYLYKDTGPGNSNLIRAAGDAGIEFNIYNS